MKVVIHHLPTGCSWSIDLGESMRTHVTQYLLDQSNGGKAILLNAENGNTYLCPAKVLSESVVRIEE